MRFKRRSGGGGLSSTRQLTAIRKQLFSVPHNSGRPVLWPFRVIVTVLLVTWQRAYFSITFPLCVFAAPRLVTVRLCSVVCWCPLMRHLHIIPFHSVNKRNNVLSSDTVYYCTNETHVDWAISPFEGVCWKHLVLYFMSWICPRAQEQLLEGVLL
jgi:hypothetical protein